MARLMRWAPPVGELEAQPHLELTPLDSGVLAAGPVGFGCVTKGKISSSDLQLGMASTLTSLSSCSPLFTRLLIQVVEDARAGLALHVHHGGGLVLQGENRQALQSIPPGASQGRMS